MNNDLWGQIQEELQETIGKNNFTNWISPLKFSEVVDGVATFKVPTTFLGNYVSQNIIDLDAPKDLKISLYSGSSVDKPMEIDTAIGKKEIINAISIVFKSC